jgi:hypothetical protein
VEFDQARSKLKKTSWSGKWKNLKTLELFFKGNNLWMKDLKFFA